MSVPVVESVQPDSLTLEPGETKDINVTMSLQTPSRMVTFDGHVRLDGVEAPGTPVLWPVEVSGGPDTQTELEFGVWGSIPSALEHAGVSCVVTRTGPQTARFRFTRSA